MIFWGLVSMAMMFIHSTTSFYAMRFLLGAAEAGFFPGVILYLTYWFPSRERGRTIAFFILGGVVAGFLGSPISGAILDTHGAVGLAGWQLLFLLEAIPAILMGFVVLMLLPDRPRAARWLSAPEKTWLETRLANEAASKSAQQCHSLAEIFALRRVWLLCAVYFLDERRHVRLRNVDAVEHHQILLRHRRPRRWLHQCRACISPPASRWCSPGGHS